MSSVRKIEASVPFFDRSMIRPGDFKRVALQATSPF
jgi:hypothetical protein